MNIVSCLAHFHSATIIEPSSGENLTRLILQAYRLASIALSDLIITGQIEGTAWKTSGIKVISKQGAATSPRQQPRDKPYSVNKKVIFLFAKFEKQETLKRWLTKELSSFPSSVCPSSLSLSLSFSAFPRVSSSFPFPLLLLFRPPLCLCIPAHKKVITFAVLHSL